MRRILLDQGMPVSAGVILRSHGWDAIHVRDFGMQAEILARALSDSRVLVTLDRDFSQILALTAASRPSVVLVRQQRLRGKAVADLLRVLWAEHEQVLDGGCVLIASDRGVRTRRLPLR